MLLLPAISVQFECLNNPSSSTIDAKHYNVSSFCIGLETVWDWAVDFRAQFAQMLSMADVVAFLGTEALKTGADLISKFWPAQSPTLGIKSAILLSDGCTTHAQPPPPTTISHTDYLLQAMIILNSY